MTTPNLSAQYAIDLYRDAFLRRFYNERRAAILASGDTVRIRLLQEHDDREARQREVA